MFFRSPRWLLHGRVDGCPIDPRYRSSRRSGQAPRPQPARRTSAHSSACRQADRPPTQSSAAKYPETLLEEVRQRVTFHRNEYAVWPGAYARRSTSAERYLVSGPEARASAATSSGRFEVSFIFTSSNPNTPGKALYFEKYVSSPSSNQGVWAARTARSRLSAHGPAKPRGRAWIRSASCWIGSVRSTGVDAAPQRTGTRPCKFIM